MKQFLCMPWGHTEERRYSSMDTHKWLLLTQTNEQIYILCILLLICPYMFQHNCYLQGAYIYVVKMFSYTGVSSLKMAIVVDCTETCRGKLIVKSTIYSFVHLLVLAECAIQFTPLKMNSIKLTTLNLCLLYILSEENVYHCRQVW